MDNTYSITSLNESAALVSFGNVIDEPINKKVISLHQYLRKKPFNGFVESVPAYSSLAIFYKGAEIVHRDATIKSAFDLVKKYIEEALSQLTLVNEIENNQAIEIPVLYDGEDLKFVAEQHRLTVNQVIDIHISRTYRVFMIGFLPGFPYMGTVDERIATTRKNSPRTSVPLGSVGIAGFQTGIYPQASPGGWQLIGRTPFRIFDKEKAKPCLLGPGDTVRFYQVDENDFEKLNEY